MAENLLNNFQFGKDFLQVVPVLLLVFLLQVLAIGTLSDLFVVLLVYPLKNQNLKICNFSPIIREIIEIETKKHRKYKILGILP